MYGKYLLGSQSMLDSERIPPRRHVEVVPLYAGLERMQWSCYVASIPASRVVGPRRSRDDCRSAMSICCMTLLLFLLLWTVCRLRLCIRRHGEWERQLHAAVQLSSIIAAARLPTFLSALSRPRISSGLSSENTLFICSECFRKAAAMRSLPRGVRATIRTRLSSALSTRLTRSFATRRSTAILIEPGVRSTIGPIVLTGNGPLCNRISSTPKSERPRPVPSIPAATYFVRARIAFIRISQTWSVA